METQEKQVLGHIDRKLAVLEEIVASEDVIYVLEVREGLLELLGIYKTALTHLKDNSVPVDQIMDYLNDNPPERFW